MKLYTATGEDGRISATTQYEEYAGDGWEQFEFPDDFDYTKQGEYRIQDGELVHDPLPPTEEEQAAQEEADRQSQMQAFVQMMVQPMAANLTDEQALTIPLLFDEWTPDTGYAAETVLRHEGELYRVARAHKSQEQWKPGETGTESPYTHITKDPETGYDVWRQPTGAHDAYNTGDRVLYPDESGKVYESLIDGNTWSPEAYPQGWKEVS